MFLSNDKNTEPDICREMIKLKMNIKLKMKDKTKILIMKRKQLNYMLNNIANRIKSFCQFVSQNI